MLRVNGSKHTMWNRIVYKYAFIEVTGDNFDIVIYSLDQTQFFIRHAKQWSYVDRKKDRFFYTKNEGTVLQLVRTWIVTWKID